MGDIVLESLLQLLCLPLYHVVAIAVVLVDECRMLCVHPNHPSMSIIKRESERVFLLIHTQYPQLYP